MRAQEAEFCTRILISICIEVKVFVKMIQRINANMMQNLKKNDMGVGAWKYKKNIYPHSTMDNIKELHHIDKKLSAQLYQRFTFCAICHFANLS